MSGDPARWSEEELNAYMARYNGITPAQAAKVTAHLPADVREFGKAFEAKGRVQQPHTGSGRMNKTEALYAELLEAQRLAGNVIEWEFEPGPLLLSPKQGTIPATRYWRDFRAVMKSGVVMAIEVKAGRDRMRESQVNYRAMVERHGGLYLIARDASQCLKDLEAYR